LHIHKSGGKLNHYLDYDIHLKINKLKKLNAPIYLTPNWKNKFDGDLGLFLHNKKEDERGELIKKITPVYNRVVF
jgi:Rps23 Pro-64 3,4-dihydroxylase Tpa1-like proline 4-hydroxylase